MKFVKFSPFATVNPASVNNLIDSVWQHSLSQVVGSDNWHSQPAVNITENEQGFQVALAAPGFSKESFKLHVEGQTLTVSAEKEATEATEGTRFLRKEFQYNKFRRVFNLPENTQIEGISAQYDNGILNIGIPKTAPVKVVKNIEIA